jgi:ABC-type transport system involved in multi-copper enzyme maturation, permease component
MKTLCPSCSRVLDLTFIVTILISLAALIFSYDAVSGEKEDGTLKLMMSNGVSRAVILLGKVLGGAISLFVAFAACFGLGLFMILLNPRVGWSGADWGALGLILAGIAVYLILFHTLGILISSRHGESASSIMTSLFVWVLVILVIPNISPYAASLISPAPSRIKTNRDVFQISQVERDELGRKLLKEKTIDLHKKYPFLAEADRMSESEIAADVRENPARVPAYQAWQAASDAAWEEANAVQDAKAQAIADDLDRREKAQTGLALRLSMISPLADFTYLATDLSSTGMRNKAYFERLSGEWSRIFSDYEEKKMADMKRADPAVSVWEAKVDVSDMPRFNYRQEPLGERLRPVLAPFAVLLIGCILLFAAAYVSFIRYDVR